MILSGFTTRYLSNENELAFEFSATLSNVTGRCEIGFTGLSGLNSHFTFESGRVYDFDNRYVWSYQQFNSLDISGNIVNNLYNYFIDGNPVCFLGNRASGYYSGFYINPINVTVDFNLNVVADAPNYSINSPISVLTGQSITGYIINQETVANRAFLIFSGDLFNAPSLFSLESLATGYKISGSGSGQFVISQNFPDSGNTWASQLGSYTIPLSLWTDFGNQITGININVIPSPIYNIEFFEMYTGASGLGLFQGYAYVYQVQTQSTGVLPYCVQLTPVSGFNGVLTGYFDLSGNYSGNVSGFIQGTDYVYGNVSGLGIAPSGDYYGNVPSGYVPFFISSLVEPTGMITYRYGLALSGFATGLAPSETSILASGHTTGQASGYIVQSGALFGSVTGLASGRYRGYLNTGIGTLRVTGFQWATGNFFVGFGNYSFSGDYTGIGYSGTSNQIYKINTGENIIINNGSGTFTFAGTKSYTGISGELRQYIVPLMIDDVTPVGEVTANNEDYAPAYLAFDRNFTTAWAPSTTIGWIQYDFGGAGTGYCNAYSITSSYDYPLYPTTWGISGSNDGVNWTYLDSKTGITFTGNYASQYFEINNSTAYNILRFSIFQSASGISSDDFSTLEITEVDFFQRNLVYTSGTSAWSRNFAGTIFSGSGNYTGTFSGNYTGSLSGNISGYVPSIFFQTGILSGTINAGSGSLTWTNILLTGNPTGFVYNLPPYKTSQATGEIWFLNSTGSGLNLGDTINLATNQFYYGNGNSVPFEFNSPQNFVNILNSGYTGAFGLSFQQSLIATGYRDNNIVRLTSLVLGESGNQQKISRVAQNPAAIYIPYRYFQSGKNFYNTSTGISGVPFTGRYNTLTVENSGNYFSTGTSGFFFNINATTGIIWNDSFSGNFQAATGNLNDIFAFVPYNTGISGFSGCSYIPAATGSYFSGINIVFQVRNPYNISGDLVSYIINVNNNYYSGLIQG